MKRQILFAAALLAAPVTAQDAPPARAPSASPAPAALSLHQRTMLRCSAAFAMLSARQAAGQATPGAPDLGTRGREFFVRASAQVMDETHADRAAIAAALKGEAQGLVGTGRLEAVLPPCLIMLDASGL